MGSQELDTTYQLNHIKCYKRKRKISAIVLYAGITSLIESVKKIIDPDTPDYSAISLIIVAVAVVVKIVLGTNYFFQRIMNVQ